ncbi:MAG: RagB/SusD family nutrient uptake outer membrane protein [Capnocytophaga sp.]|nr:RagB/SusD family nutrient uptake outer membrane protein [Capnocytophaga sp.]
MKKNIIHSILLLAGLLTASCNNFLDREPLDSVPLERYLWSESDLAAYSIRQYGLFPTHAGFGLGTFASDNNSDNQAGVGENGLFVPKRWRVGQSGGAWGFGSIRDVNYFINTVQPRLDNGELTGNAANVRHYLGEMYFFRAYIYFSKLESLGDFPILKEWITEDYDVVRENSKRRPRNEVARFILEDLDKAISYLNTAAPQSNRLNKNAALLFKSRVALFEGTWLKYHKGTARVPGGPGWPGAGKDYLSGFSINIDSEINFFLTEAKEAARQVADNVALSPNYEQMFNSITLNVPEVLLWRQYDANVTPMVNHYVVGYIQRNGGGGTGFTRSFVESILMSNGLPIYAAASGYQGDETFAKVFAGRDNRMKYNILNEGDLLTTRASFTEYIVNGNGYFYRPPLTENGENRSTTGYSIKKGLMTDPAQGPTLPSTTASVVFRAAEAYLNYMEADFELSNTLDANSLRYWKALRTRSGVSDDVNATIAATDLTKENDLAVYSGSTPVDATLYNIRRERRIELAAEGSRLRDLRRWRALDKMDGYIVEGFNLWDENYLKYEADATLGLPKIELKETGVANPSVSARTDSKYLRPYRINTSNEAFDGYKFNPVKYLDPIAFDHFRLTTDTPGNTDYTTSTIYQNPGWKIETNSLPEGD